MLPGTSSEDLLYISDTRTVHVYTYPELKPVVQLSGMSPSANFTGLCVDPQGNVFVPTWQGESGVPGYVYKFAHGGSTPIATLSDPGGAVGCSVDLGTGNLAVTNGLAPGSEFHHGNVAIYQHAQGTPTIYTDPDIYWPSWVAYDNHGDLFIDGNTEVSGLPLAELVKGSRKFRRVSLNEQFDPLSLQWEKGYLVIAGSARNYGPQYIYQVQMTGLSGTIVKTTRLDNQVEYDGNGQYWVQGHRILGPGREHYRLQVWRFPKGGHSVDGISGLTPWGVTISLAPSASHVRK